MFRPRTRNSRPSEGLWRGLELAIRALFSFVIVGVISRFCWSGLCTSIAAHRHYHANNVTLDNDDPYKCSALLNEGSWLDPARSWNSQDDFKNWQPPGCMMHEYKAQDIQECFQDRRLIFIGDSTIRQVYWAIASKLDEKKAASEEAVIADMKSKHMDAEFMSRGVKIQFIWDPFLNSSKLEHELRYFKPNPSPDVVDNSAGLILIGTPGLWYAQNGTEDYLREFRDSVENIIPFMDHSSNSKSQKSNPFPARTNAPNLLLLAPVQTPRFQLLDPGKAAVITPNKTDQMNEYLRQVSAHSEVDVAWSYSAMLENGIRQYEDSIHVVRNVNLRKADVLLNLRCNGVSAKMGYPFNRTCCTSYARTAGVQWIILLLGIVIFPMLLLGRYKFTWRLGCFLPPVDVMKALTIFALIIVLCFYTDRTQLFEKGHKYFTIGAFRWSCLAIAVVGASLIRPNRLIQNKLSGQMDGGFLSREQTDEWKGWMQSLILAYHYTGASQTLWIYKIVRLLVTAYLFMTGYGHTLYFLRRNDYSLKRVATTLIRLNLLSIALPYMMLTNYQTYYFAPLVTYWFLVVYWTLKIRPTYNTSLVLLSGKLLVSASLTCIFTNCFRILELVKFVLMYTCAISFDVREWRFRTNLDLCIVYIGMMLAALYHRGTQPLKSNSNMNKFLIFSQSNDGRVLALLIAPFAIPGYWSLACRASAKEAYNLWHPYISFIPVLGYVLLRNTDVTIHKYRINLRHHHSVIFAWLGRFSLETFVLQCHLWLAADTKGILHTGLLGPKMDTAVLTLLFLWLSSCAANATQAITDWIIDGASSRSKDADSYEMSNNQLLPNPRMAKRSTGGKGRRATFERWIFRGLLSLRNDLRTRLAVFLFMMWLGNVTCYLW